MRQRAFLMAPRSRRTPPRPIVPAMNPRILRTTPLVFGACALPIATGRAPQAPVVPPTISTNRPSFSDSATLVPANHLQVETGYTFTGRSRNGTRTERHAVPEVLTRYRLLERLEGQLLWSGFVRQDTHAGGTSTHDSGAGDPGLGIRVPIEDQHGWMPTLALGASATLGLGDDTFGTGNHTVPTGKVLWSYAFDGGLGLGGNFVVGHLHDGQERFEQVAASVYGTLVLGDRTSVFGEYFVVTPYANGTGPAHSIDGGVLWLASRTVQLDARIGCGLNDEADDFFAGTGISFLF